MSTLEDIPTFDLELAEMGEPKAADPKEIALDDNPNLKHKVNKRRQVELEQRSNAIEQIGSLPRASETIHLRMDGTFNGVELVEALVELAAPVADLTIATLSYNRRVTQRILDMIDAGKVRQCTVLVSSMFEGKERESVDWLADELRQRGSRQLIARNHQKLIMIAAGNRRFVAEGSQNLRTCRCYEQVTLTNSRKLYQWHAAFIERIARGEVN